MVHKENFHLLLQEHFFNVYLHLKLLNQLITGPEIDSVIFLNLHQVGNIVVEA